MQQWREMIPHKKYTEFQLFLKEAMKNYTAKNQYRMRAGIMCEYRAYHYLKAQNPHNEVIITGLKDDRKGIDIIVRKDDKDLRFQVKGGGLGKVNLKEEVDYYLVVTNTISIYKKSVADTLIKKQNYPTRKV